MKWFKHDTDAHIDARLEKLTMKYGAEGYGIYWYCLEIIAGKITKDKITFELEHDAEIIGHRLKVDQIKVQEIMSHMVKVGLFQNNKGIISCMALASRLQYSAIKNPQLAVIQANITENPRLSEKIPDKLCQIRLEQIRLDKNRREEEKKEVAPLFHASEFVRLSVSQYRKLWKEHGRKNVRKLIDKLDAFLGSKKKDPYRSHYHAIRKWVVDACGLTTQSISVSTSRKPDTALLKKLEEETKRGVASHYSQGLPETP